MFAKVFMFIIYIGMVWTFFGATENSVNSKANFLRWLFYTICKSAQLEVQVLNKCSYQDMCFDNINIPNRHCMMKN